MNDDYYFCQLIEKSKESCQEVEAKINELNVTLQDIKDVCNDARLVLNYMLRVLNMELGYAVNIVKILQDVLTDTGKEE